MQTDQIQYGGFWKRAAALLLDGLVLSPLTLAVVFLSHRYRLFGVYYLGPGTLFELFYGVFLVRRYGGTPGKLIMGLRIRKVSGEAVGYREAFLRYAPEFLLGLLMSIGLIMAALQMSDAQYYALSLADRSKRLFDLTPGWFKPVRILLHIWMWGELIVLLTNRKRRALHDFVAGTVVVLDKTGLPMERTPALAAPAVPDDLAISTTPSEAGPPPASFSLFSLGPAARWIYRLLIGFRGCWLLLEWLFNWGPRSHIASSASLDPFGTLITDGMAVAVWLTLLGGMWFFQRWARILFVPVGAYALLSIPAWFHGYLRSSPPPFVPVIGVLALLATGAILAISFLPPVRDEFAAESA